MNRKTSLIAVFLLLLSETCWANLVIFTCEPEWAQLVTEIAGADMNPFSATTPFQDPHRIQARPSLIAKIRHADLLVCTGADLEVGWLPLLLRRSGNSRIQPGRPGYFMAADHVRKLEIPTRLDRAEGDIHPQGNPHIHLDPRNLLRIAEQLSKRLVELDPANANRYLEGYTKFSESFRLKIKKWQDKADPLKSMMVITHHRSFSYLVRWLGIDVVETIENKPGIPPSSKHMARLLQLAEVRNPKFVLLTPYSDPKPAEWLSERTHIPIIRLPYTVGSGHSAQTLSELFDATLNLLLGQP